MEDFKGFIEDFFKGRVDGLLNDMDTTVFSKENEAIIRLKDKLISVLTDEEKAIFGKYCDTVNQHFANVLDEIYKQGVTDGLMLFDILKGGESK